LCRWVTTELLSAIYRHNYARELYTILLINFDRLIIISTSTLSYFLLYIYNIHCMQYMLKYIILKFCTVIRNIAYRIILNIFYLNRRFFFLSHFFLYIIYLPELHSWWLNLWYKFIIKKRKMNKFLVGSYKFKMFCRSFWAYKKYK